MTKYTKDIGKKHHIIYRKGDFTAVVVGRMTVMFLSGTVGEYSSIHFMPEQRVVLIDVGTNTWTRYPNIPINLNVFTTASIYFEKSGKRYNHIQGSYFMADQRKLRIV